MKKEEKLEENISENSDVIEVEVKIEPEPESEPETVSDIVSTPKSDFDTGSDGDAEEVTVEGEESPDSPSEPDEVIEETGIPFGETQEEDGEETVQEDADADPTAFDQFTERVNQKAEEIGEKLPSEEEARAAAEEFLTKLKETMDIVGANVKSGLKSHGIDTDKFVEATANDFRSFAEAVQAGAAAFSDHLSEKVESSENNAGDNEDGE